MGAPAAAQGQPSETVIKGFYLTRLAAFVTWPASTFPTPDAPLTICIQGVDPFGPKLDDMVAKWGVGGHPLVVRREPKLGPKAACQIAYLAGSSEQTPAQALQAVGAAPVMTVTDQGQATGAHGVLDLYPEAGRVRFSVDTAQAARNGLTISSKLLALAAGTKP